MGDVPTTDNTAAEVFDTVIKDAETIGDAAAEKAIEAAVVAEVPLFGLPVVFQLFDAAVTWVVTSISTLFSKGLQATGTFWIIRFQSQGQMTAAQGRLLKLQQDALAKASDGIITADEQAWLDAVSSFLHSDGSATPK